MHSVESCPRGAAQAVHSHREPSYQWLPVLGCCAGWGGRGDGAGRLPPRPTPPQVESEVAADTSLAPVSQPGHQGCAQGTRLGRCAQVHVRVPTTKPSPRETTVSLEVPRQMGTDAHSLTGFKVTKLFSLILGNLIYLYPRSKVYIYQSNQAFRFPQVLNIQNHVILFKRS